jgi:hypothetical protein
MRSLLAALAASAMLTLLSYSAWAIGGAGGMTIGGPATYKGNNVACLYCGPPADICLTLEWVSGGQCQTTFSSKKGEIDVGLAASETDGSGTVCAKKVVQIQGGCSDTTCVCEYRVDKFK